MWTNVMENGWCYFLLLSVFFLCQATSPQTGGSMKSMKDSKSSQQEKDKDVQEGSGLKTAGPEGEITAGSCQKDATDVLLI